MADYINLRDQRQMTITLPPTSVQRAVASVLNCYDELIQNNLRRIEILEELSRAMYRDLIAGAHESKTDQVTLGSVAENFDRLRRPLSKMQRADMQGDIPYYGAAKIVDYINDHIFDGEFLLFAEDGTVITDRGTPVLQLVNGRFWANNHTHILRGTRLPTRFLYLALLDYPIIGHITGAAQPKITQANLNRVALSCPSSDALNGFMKHINPQLDLIQHLHRQNFVLSSARDLLLPRLVSGDIDVSELDIDTSWLAA